jgi:hypothetical protein
LTLAGNKLTFIAKAFEAGSDNTYRVKIKATVDVTIFFVRFPFETTSQLLKTLIGYSTTQVVFIDGKLNHQNESKVIELTINENHLGGVVSNQGFEKLTGADADKFTV